MPPRGLAANLFRPIPPPGAGPPTINPGFAFNDGGVGGGSVETPINPKGPPPDTSQVQAPGFTPQPGPVTGGLPPPPPVNVTASPPPQAPAPPPPAPVNVTFNPPVTAGSTEAPPGGGQFVDFGQNPFSQLVEGNLESIIGSGGQPSSGFAQDVRGQIGGQFASLAPSGVTGQAQGALGDILGGGRNIESFIDQRVIDQNTESLREGLDSQRRSQTDQLEARLAARGLVGSGAQRTGLQGIERDIAQAFVTGQRNIGTDELARARGSFEGAVGLGEAGRQFDANQRGQLLGLSQSAAATDQAAQLNALQQGTNRQGMLSDVANTLMQNSQAAAEFAAQFGLSREQLLESLQRLDATQLQSLVDKFIASAGTAQRGAVGTPA